jgi:hypothetical protein
MTLIHILCQSSNKDLAREECFGDCEVKHCNVYGVSDFKAGKNTF